MTLLHDVYLTPPEIAKAKDLERRLRYLESLRLSSITRASGYAEGPLLVLGSDTTYTTAFTVNLYVPADTLTTIGVGASIETIIAGNIQITLTETTEGLGEAGTSRWKVISRFDAPGEEHIAFASANSDSGDIYQVPLTVRQNEGDRSFRVDYRVNAPTGTASQLHARINRLWMTVESR